MAFVTTFECVRCGQLVRQAIDHRRTCFACSQKSADEKKAEFLKSRAALSVEDRLCLLEEAEYDKSLNQQTQPLC